MLLQLLDTGIGGAAAAIAFEAERLGDDADGEDALVARRLGDDGRGAGAGAAAHTGGNKAHMGAVERLFDLGDCFLGGRSEAHTSALQSLMRISYAVFCLHKK